jgi:predicted adenine nucleotide alpha hydrolase (AANH) superfamily ATPase
MLLHTCCAPCLIHPAALMEKRDWEIHPYFFNPNIHPSREYLKRKEALKKYSGITGLNVIFSENYPLEEFLRLVASEPENRCFHCYRIRLDMTARKCLELGFEVFSTTLLVSPYQKHETIRLMGEETAREHNLRFYYEDFREGFRWAQARAREMELYRQAYCGCIYSEKERYLRPEVKAAGKNGRRDE